MLGLCVGYNIDEELAYFGEIMVLDSITSIGEELALVICLSGRGVTCCEHAT